MCRIVFLKCSVEGFVQLRNKSLSYIYIVIVKPGCLCKIVSFFSWMGGVGGGGRSEGVSPGE